MADAADEEAPGVEPTRIQALPRMPEVLPLTDFELEVRQRLANLESHVVRSDGLLMALQLEHRLQVTGLRSQIDARTAELRGLIAGLTKSIAELAPMLRKLTGNGSDHA